MYRNHRTIARPIPERFTAIIGSDGRSLPRDFVTNQVLEVSDPLKKKKGTFFFSVEPASQIQEILAIPRAVRVSVGRLYDHVLNRGNARAETFRKPEDYAAVLALLREAPDCVPVRPLPPIASSPRMSTLRIHDNKQDASD